MRRLLLRLIDLVAKRQVLDRSDCSIAPSAKVNYRGIRHKPPSTLSIGDRWDAFKGQILSDRAGSVVTIGKRTFIGGSSLICAERIDIGDDTLISWGCTIVDHDSHAVNWNGRSKDVSDWYEGKRLDQGKRSTRQDRRSCVDRLRAIVLSGVTIGENAVVGCGSVVTRDVRASYASRRQSCPLHRPIDD